MAPVPHQFANETTPLELVKLDDNFDAFQAAAGSSLVGFNNGGTNAITRTTEAKMRETVSVKDFGATGNGVTDDTAALQAAFNTGKAIYIPGGNYFVTSTLNVTTSGQLIYGDGYQSFISCPSGTCFNVTAGNVTMTDVRIWGGYTTNNIGILCSSFQCKFLNIDMRLFDVGFRWTGGFHLFIQNWNTRNFRTYGIHLANGVGAHINDVTYDTDGPYYGGAYSQPTAFLLINNEGNVISNLDLIHPGVGCWIETNGRTIEWCMFDNCFAADSGYVEAAPPAGILIRQSSNTHWIRGLFFSHVWSATNNRGVVVDGAGTAPINGVVFKDCMLHNSRYEGVRIDTDSLVNIRFNDCEISGNSALTTGEANQVYINRASNVKLENCEIGNNFTWNSTPLTQIFIDSLAENVDLVSNTLGTQVSSTPLVAYNGSQTKISHPRWMPIFTQTISAPTAGVQIGGPSVPIQAFDEILITYENIAHTDTGDLNIIFSTDNLVTLANISYQTVQGTNLIGEYETVVNGNRALLSGSNIQGSLRVTNNSVGYKHFTHQSSLNAAAGQNLLSTGTVNVLNPINTIFLGWTLGNLTGGTIRVFAK